MQTYVDGLLREYYAYRRRSNRVALGFKSETIESRLYREGGVLIRSTAQPEWRKKDSEAEQTGQALAKLERDLRRVCDVAYGMAGAPESAKIREVGVSRPTYYRRLDQAHQQLMGLINDEVAKYEF